MHPDPDKTFFGPYSISDPYPVSIDVRMIINTPLIWQLSLDGDFFELFQSLDEKTLWMLTVALTVTIGTKLLQAS